MKKIYTIVCVIISFQSLLLAQNNSSTLNFMGIPLGISITEFKQKMLSKGFKYNAEESNSIVYSDMYLFKGRFAGENVGVSVSVTPHSRIVYSVNVRFIDYNHPLNMTEDAQRAQLSKFYEIREAIRKKYKFEPIDWSKDFIVKASSWEKTAWSIFLSLSYETRSVQWPTNDYLSYETRLVQWQTIDLMYTDKKAEKKAEIEKENDY